MLIGAPAASATPTAEYLGVNVQPLMKDGTIPETSWNNYLGPLQSGGLDLVRHDINWFLAEPAAPKTPGVHVYTWNNTSSALRNSIDYQMTALVSHGIRVAPSFTGLPTWASKEQSTAPESWFSDFGDFVAAFATRYGPGGAFWTENPQLPYLPVVNYEIWNEANSANSWTGQPDAAGYARMLQIVYPKVKAVQPNVTVEASIGWPDANNFVDGIFGGGGGGAFDAIAFHPYAPIATSIIGLVSSLRTHLGALGRGGIPINVTETGEPVALAPPYNAHAYMGGVSDSARAATQTFTADALAHSDCNVNQFLVYAITGSETNREIISEGFMGIERYADGSMNITGQSLARAAQRWEAAVAAGTAVSNGQLGICSGAITPPAALLPLGITAVPSTHGCVTGTVTYDGNPLEGSALILTTADGRSASTAPDAFGQSDVCIPAGPAIKTFQVHAEVPNMAISPYLTCYVDTMSCSPPLAVVAKPAPVCTVLFPKIKPKTATVGKLSKTKITARLNCDAFKTTYVITKKTKVKLKGKTKAGKARYKTVIKKITKVRQPLFTIAIDRAAPKATKKKPKPKKPKDIKLRTITLRHDLKVTFTVKRTFATGQTLVLIHKVNKKDKLPALRITVPLTVKAAKKAKTKATTATAKSTATAK